MWRGSVTHVPSGEKRYFDAFAHLVEHMERYLEMLGVPGERNAGTAASAGRRRKRGGLTQGTNSLVDTPDPPVVQWTFLSVISSG